MIYREENFFALENQLITDVKLGKFKNSEEIITSVAFGDKDLKYTKIYFFELNALLRKAAEKCGVPIELIIPKSEDFIIRIDNITESSNTYDIINNMMHVYCELVKNYSKSNYSTPVFRAIIKIDSDLSDDLSLKSLAELNNISAGYFSSLFKKETGMTLTDYINKKRILYAKELLSSTKLQINDIAYKVGLKDTNYFIKLFKKYEGITPKQYRKNS